MNNQIASDTSNLENNLENENPIHKRRSLVFQNRAVVFGECEGTQQLKNEKSVDVKDGTACGSEDVQEKTFDLEQYINSLRQERKIWLKTWKERKAERRVLAKQKSALEAHGQSLDLSVLSDSERAFIKARPNYEQIWKSNKRLATAALKVATLNQVVYEVNKKFITQMEGKLQDITKNVIKLSEL